MRNEEEARGRMRKEGKETAGVQKSRKMSEREEENEYESGK